MDQWSVILDKYGPLAAMLVFFIWRDFKREARMSKRLDNQADFISNALVVLTKETQTIMLACKASIDRGNVLNEESIDLRRRELNLKERETRRWDEHRKGGVKHEGGHSSQDHGDSRG